VEKGCQSMERGEPSASSAIDTFINHRVCLKENNLNLSISIAYEPLILPISFHIPRQIFPSKRKREREEKIVEGEGGMKEKNQLCS
jgi:hypothetical protein